MAYGSASCTILDDSEDLDSDPVNPRLADSNSSSNDSEITFGERLKICCTPKYRPRKLQHKEAFLVLVWNFFVTPVFYYLYYKTLTSENFCPICFHLIIPLPLGVSVVVLGWLGDVYVGRYKGLKWSIIVMWMSILLLTTTFVVESIVKFTNYYQLVFLVPLGVSYGMFQVNIIQFGIDQLIDASTIEIESFVNWYAWSFVSSAVLTNFTVKCASVQNKFIAPLMLCVALSIVASSLFLFNNALIKEPVTQNHLKLIYKVIKYALKHKHAQRRSAFTYCEDDLPSRLDFAKSKYGGPFTTEQVEDVKTFFRVLGLVLTIGYGFGATQENTIRQHIYGQNYYIHELDKCSISFMFIDMYYLTSSLLIPLNELIVHPFFQRCLPRIIGSWKIIIGLTLKVISYVLMIILITVSRQHDMMESVNVNNTSTSLPCIFNATIPVSGYSSRNVFSSKLYVIPDIIASVSFTMMLVGIIEFFCAQ